jgi:hypothetical protein
VYSWLHIIDLSFESDCLPCREVVADKPGKRAIVALVVHFFLSKYIQDCKVIP